MGIKESTLPPSIVEDNSFPGIDPDELKQGEEDEKEEHGMSDEKAKQTAAQHLKEPDQHHYYSGIEKAKQQGMLKDMLNPIMSPTALQIPVIGVSVRGSTSGGLPSGRDQTNPDLSPRNLGGYEKIPIDGAHSTLIDKTPCNSQINSDTPIATDIQPPDEDVHPHQIQNSSGEKPQSVTGASTDSSDSITVKQSEPTGIDIEVEDSGEEEKNKSSNRGNNPNKESGMGYGMSTVTEGKHKNGCKCGFCANNGKFKKKSIDDKDDTEKTENDKKEDSVNETFARHKGFLSIKLMENAGANDPFITKWKMDKEKAGMVKVDEEKWMQKATTPSTKGALHKELGIPEDQKIPTEKLESIKQRLHSKSETESGLTEKELKLSRRVNAALNMRKS